MNQALEEARRQFGGYRDTDFLPHVDPHSKYDRADQSKWQQNMGGQKRTYERTTQSESADRTYGSEARSGSAEQAYGRRSMQVVLVKVSQQRRMRRGFSQLEKYLGFC